MAMPRTLTIKVLRYGCTGAEEAPSRLTTGAVFLLYLVGKSTKLDFVTDSLRHTVSYTPFDPIIQIVPGNITHNILCSSCVGVQVVVQVFCSNFNPRNETVTIDFPIPSPGVPNDDAVCMSECSNYDPWTCEVSSFPRDIYWSLSY